MIQQVTIKNFKSVQDLTISLSRFNIFVGSNGSSKSNILEAIAFGAAAAADKLDNEFLGSRGIRASEAKLMKSAFSLDSNSKGVEVTFQADAVNTSFMIEETQKPILRWEIKDKRTGSYRIANLLISIVTNKEEELNNNLDFFDTPEKEKIIHLATQFWNLESKKNRHGSNDKLIEIFDFLSISEGSHLTKNLSDFIIYSPEISALRKFEETSQILPLGIKGEGLFNVLQIFYETYSPETIDQLKEFLHIIEWFDDFEARFDKITGRKILTVKDRYLPGVVLNQYNVNEGFLFLLFYVSLILSKETPAFFAIDNIETSFHPRLCKELTRRLIELCKKHDKQVIITTHNPAVLDGLNLNDPEQSLFVIRRNADGETIADKIATQPKNVKLSEAWERGYIGGQPETIE